MKIYDADEDSEPILSIEVARRKYGAGDCDHSQVIVDERLALLECRRCGKAVDPIHFVVHLSRKWEHMERARKRSEAMVRLLAERRKTKCNHCGAMATIRWSPSEAKLNQEVIRLEAGRWLIP